VFRGPFPRCTPGTLERSWQNLDAHSCSMRGLERDSRCCTSSKRRSSGICARPCVRPAPAQALRCGPLATRQPARALGQPVPLSELAATQASIRFRARRVSSNRASGLAATPFKMLTCVFRRARSAPRPPGCTLFGSHRGVADFADQLHSRRTFKRGVGRGLRACYPLPGAAA